MKKAFLILLMVFVLVGVCVTASAIYTFSGSWSERECAICSKTVYKFCEGGSGDTYYMPSGGMRWHEDSTSELSWSQVLYLCDECYKKYSNDYYEVMGMAHTEWLNRIVAENEELRAQVKKARLKKEMRELEKEMLEIEEKMRGNPFYELLKLEEK